MQNLITKNYLGNNISFKLVNGHVYADANKMAEGFGGNKKLENWKISENTKRYIFVLSKNPKFQGIELTQSERGTNGGTWIHEKLILNFARYLNVEFELWCDEQITTLLREGEVKIKSPVSDEAKKKRLEIMEKNANVRMSKQYTKLAELTPNERHREVLIALGANTLSNKEVLPLPKLEQKSYTAEEIGKVLRISANMVGRLANKYNLKTERYGYWAQDKAKNCNKTIESFRYYEHVIKEFKKVLEKGE